MIPPYLSRSPIEYSKDLTDVDESSTDLAIFGDAKALERIKEFPNIKRVWLNGANQKQFDLVVSLVNPISFKGYNLRVPNLNALQGLSGIEELSIEWNTKAGSIAPIGELTSLKVLQIQDFTRVHDLTPIQRLSDLITLDISGGVWNTFKVETLEPLGDLKNLLYLCLANIRVLDQSLEPVSRLTQLQELSISNQFPTEEYARLTANLTNTKCDYFRAFIELKQMLGEHDIMVVGKRKPFLNQKKDSDRVKKYQNAFDQLVEKHRAQPVR
ncbi:hypothetical protein QEH52_19840 [Coraliomargarita sp. SDUM461003]|uniref:Internalin n=1 Tax=Thalassobacterium maritimum TaxID=3041265 RepID=A0ABU1B0B9_9BACT|nr:hypothetical protein [Coraliomargarita sp. SDUM461003]MDQ8209781.1 hypothetical protein [Coraliomargarita sp. SDUM461003]|tara:strand:- start:1142 stop:1951 length:810 start_codon:yes stop_codon:yes gene_type:complete